MPPHTLDFESNSSQGSISSNMGYSTEEIVLVTTYTHPDKLAHTPKGDNGAGLYAFKLDLASGKLTERGSIGVSPNPAFLVKHPNLDVVYGTTECIDGPGDVLSFHVNMQAPACLDLVSRQAAGGRSTCYLNIAADCESITAVNYWDAKVCTMPLDSMGNVGSVCDTVVHPGAEYVDQANPDRTEHWMYRQRWPHAHCAVTEPYSSGQGRLYVCDLGKDSIVEYELSKETGKPALTRTGEIQLESSLGPRHLIFHPHVMVAYSVNELTSSVSAFKYNRKELNGNKEDASTPGALLEHMQTISTLPTDWQDKQTIKNGVWKAASHCSEIRMHPSGKLLFVANRGHDSLAIFKIDEATGALQLASIHASNGMCPRNYNFCSNGRWVIVGNQDSNNLTVLEVDVDAGTLRQASCVPCPAPNYVYCLPRSRPLQPNAGS
mmetsp:Transcript_47938/g.74869  ORF Transcript_47938/g.74869 Transcript_47938/m.74869 type:complete len:435 (+) Transcript_47938:124-1428(+)